jgi:hypothetical protein
VTVLQVFGTTFAFLLCLLPSALVIVFRHEVVEVNRRKAYRLAINHPSLAPMYRQAGDGLHPAQFVVGAIIWAVVSTSSLIGGTVSAIG